MRPWAWVMVGVVSAELFGLVLLLGHYWLERWRDRRLCERMESLIRSAAP